MSPAGDTHRPLLFFSSGLLLLPLVPLLRLSRRRRPPPRAPRRIGHRRVMPCKSVRAAAALFLIPTARRRRGPCATRVRRGGPGADDAVVLRGASGGVPTLAVFVSVRRRRRSGQKRAGNTSSRRARAPYARRCGRPCGRAEGPDVFRQSKREREGERERE